MVLWERSVDAPGVCRCQGAAGEEEGEGVVPAGGALGRCPRMLGGGVCVWEGRGWGLPGVDRARE